jgi:hypothetical protein
MKGIENGKSNSLFRALGFIFLIQNSLSKSPSRLVYRGIALIFVSATGRRSRSVPASETFSYPVESGIHPAQNPGRSGAYIVRDIPSQRNSIAALRNLII